MPLSSCPKCGTTYHIKPENVGKLYDCTKCHEQFVFENQASSNTRNDAKPNSVAAKVRLQRQKQAEEDARFVRKLLIVVGCIAGVALLALLDYFDMLLYVIAGLAVTGIIAALYWSNRYWSAWDKSHYQQPQPQPQSHYHSRNRSQNRSLRPTPRKRRSRATSRLHASL
jgi:hypothetical protein